MLRDVRKRTFKFGRGKQTPAHRSAAPEGLSWLEFSIHPPFKEFIINTMSFVLARALSQAEAMSIAHAPNQNLEHLQ
ncbi:hypothetical protein [Variovorax sp. HW608]|uniref:hypothetical protein n=1 Tax=Variovorax sp. HW608 TaxID=1034889 RepID=UPI001E36B271|nr:hypothetical protein [Variovorax sp. HW608]